MTNKAPNQHPYLFKASRKPKRPFISASRRTDIPAYYSQWFVNRIKQGWCIVVNPFNPAYKIRVSLTPEDVKAIFFWTRNALPMLRHLDLLESIGHTRYLFHYTLTPYGPPIEKNAPPLAIQIERLKRLSDRIGPERVLWRYDPIIVSKYFSFTWHLKQFEYLCRSLHKHTGRVIVSLIDWYHKTQRRMKEFEAKFGPFQKYDGTEDEVIQFASELKKIAEAYNLEIQSCCEPGFDMAGIPRGACIDAQLVNRIFNLNIKPRKDPGQRKECLCHPSYDIGAPDTCITGCAYCYSTKSHELAKENFKRHDPKAPLLMQPQNSEV